MALPLRLNTSMTLNDIPSSESPFAFESLSHWAKELKIPLRSLLHHSASGYLPVFALPRHQVDYYAVHESSLLETSSTSIRKSIHLSDHGVMGLILSNEDVAQLAAGKHGEVSWFYSLIRKNAGWIEFTPPNPDRSGLPEREDGWWVAAYRRASPSDRAHWSVDTPVSLQVSAERHGLYVRNMDIASFVHCLQTGQFVEDLIIDGKVVEELPPYVSIKLREMVDANRLYWRGYGDIDLAEKERRQTETRKYLREDFWAHCDKTTNPESLLDFATDACDPSSVPTTKRLSASPITPDLRAMLTAAKLFWLPYCSYEASDATYPSREAIIDFLRFMGVRSSNAPVSATTIIRPEGVTSPPPSTKKTLLTPLKRSQALPR